jgi:hypothetical protein
MDTATRGYQPFDYTEEVVVRSEEILDKLLEDLQMLFSSGGGSAREQDEDGSTLLHVRPALYDPSEEADIWVYVGIHQRNSWDR